jgi:Transglutaminase-like superfamily
MRKTMGLLCVLLAARAVAGEYESRIEHGGTGYGSVTFEWRRDALRATTQETARILIRSGGAGETLLLEQRSEESADGRPLSLWRRSSAGPERQEASAEVRGGQLHLRRRLGAQETREVLPLPPGLLVEAGLLRRIAQQPAGSAWSFDYDEFDVFTARFAHVRLSSEGLPVDGVLELRKDSDSNGLRRSQRLRWSVAQQRLLPVWNLAGALFTSQPCANDCSAGAQQYFDLLGGLAVASKYRIPAQARRKTLRYVFENADGTPPRIPVTSEQAVAQRGARAVVTVCADCGDEAPPGAENLARYRRANAWVESDSAELRGFAAGVRSLGSIAARMHRLEMAVYRHMTGTQATLGYASALQALRSRSGDCTEFAVLLAALARAEGLPARVVGGLAYASRFSGRRDVFSPHAWVQVWDGRRWVSFDAGLGEFDSTHIVLAVGDGSAEDYRGLLERIRQLRLVDAGQVQ